MNFSGDTASLKRTGNHLILTHGIEVVVVILRCSLWRNRCCCDSFLFQWYETNSSQMFPNRGRRSFMVFCDPVLELYREVLLHVKLERVRVTSHSAAQHCYMFAWWRHQMEIFSALLAICAGISPVTGELPAQRPATRSFAAFFDLHLNKQLSKQSWGW